LRVDVGVEFAAVESASLGRAELALSGGFR
jgi:hypothetical protein